MSLCVTQYKIYVTQIEIIAKAISTNIVLIIIINTTIAIIATIIILVIITIAIIRLKKALQHHFESPGWV